MEARNEARATCMTDALMPTIIPQISVSLI